MLSQTRELKQTKHNIKCRENSHKNYHEGNGALLKMKRYYMKKYNLEESFFNEEDTLEEKVMKIKLYDYDQKVNKILRKN